MLNRPTRQIGQIIHVGTRSLCQRWIYFQEYPNRINFLLQESDLRWRRSIVQSPISEHVTTLKTHKRTLSSREMSLNRSWPWWMLPATNKFEFGMMHLQNMETHSPWHRRSEARERSTRYGRQKTHPDPGASKLWWHRWTYACSKSSRQTKDKAGDPRNHRPTKD